VRAEDYDWEIYHVITRAKGCRVEDICETSGFSPEIVQMSLDRLSAHLLIECRGDHYRACSIEEFMVLNHMKHDPFSQVIIENGVVKVRSTDLRKTDDGGDSRGSG
jgi:hypothetical protein